MDYSIFFKSDVPIDEPIIGNWDLFISAYVPNERVCKVFDLVSAKEKHWLVFPEYELENAAPTGGKVFTYKSTDEADFINKYEEQVACKFDEIELCIDITGFIHPHLMYLLRLLHERKVKKFDVIYSEPGWYKQSEKTKFSNESVRVVKQVLGYEGQLTTDTSNDLLIIGAGYDDMLISRVAENKSTARKIQIFGFPPLQPDMYQENIIRASRASEAVGQPIGMEDNNHFAPAGDPFITANVLSSIVRAEGEKKRITNLYLSPLSTKVQTLGFCLFFLWECVGTHASILYPYCNNYPHETSVGISRIKKFTVVLPDSTK